MTRIIVNILLTILIIWLGWWARIVWIPAMLLAIVWAGWYYRQLFRQWWANFRSRYKKRAAVTSAAVIMGCGLLAGILLYRLIFELISVPSPSMEKAIDAGDYIVVNKL
ncbi:MAG: signal peptidase I, partial [Marinilabilia sp.]